MADVAREMDRMAGGRSESYEPKLKRRHAAERRFRLYGVVAITLAIAALGVLLVTIVSKGSSAFTQAHIQMDVFFDPAEKVGARTAAALLDHGVIARAMPQGDILGFAPPLCLTRAEADIIVERAATAVATVLP